MSATASSPVDSGVEHLLRAERSVLGAMLLHADCAPAVAAIITPADYYLRAHQIVARAIADAHREHGATDPLAVAEILRQRGQFAEVGGEHVLLDLAEGCISAAGVELHAAIVREAAEHRRVAAAIARAQRLQSEGADVAEVRRVLATELAEAPARTGSRRALVSSLDDLCSAPPIAWQVDGLIPAAAVNFLVSPPNTGKSTLAIDLTLRAATGSDWHGRRARAGSCIYVVGEGAAGLGQRVRAWFGHHPDARMQHHVTMVRRLPPLSGVDGMAELRAILREHTAAHGAPVLVIIDTLATHWAESEDRSEFVGPAMAALAEIAVEHGCAVEILHHERKPQQGAGGGAWAALRGSSAWAGAADSVLSLREAGGVVELSVSKQRDAERAAPMHFRIVGADVPGLADGQGRPVRAPVLVPAAEDAASGAAAPLSRVARDADAIVRLLKPGMTLRALRAAATASGAEIGRERLEAGIALLVQSRRVRTEEGPRGAVLHYPSTEGT